MARSQQSWRGPGGSASSVSTTWPGSRARRTLLFFVPGSHFGILTSDIGLSAAAGTPWPDPGPLAVLCSPARRPSAVTLMFLPSSLFPFLPKRSFSPGRGAGGGQRFTADSRPETVLRAGGQREARPASAQGLRPKVRLELGCRDPRGWGSSSQLAGCWRNSFLAAGGLRSPFSCWLSARITLSLRGCPQLLVRCLGQQDKLSHQRPPATALRPS